MIELRPHEERFDIRPVGIRYICEFCNEGEMIATGNVSRMIATNPPSLLVPHRCNKCGKEMELPRSYPYVDWEEVDYHDTN